MQPIFLMWSGPRNLSTAMMRAWENRPDTKVVDEPFYAAYLKRTGLRHPMTDEILAELENDPHKVADWLATADQQQLFYQKQMTHHFLPEFPTEWLKKVRHCFLLRDPMEVLLSYSQKIPHAEMKDVGFDSQKRIYDWVCANVTPTPMIVDAKDFLRDPEGYLRMMCQELGVPFYQSMLKWPPGRRDSDGVWADHWYDSVIQTTGFAQWKPRSGKLLPEFEKILGPATEIYDEMSAKRIQI